MKMTTVLFYFYFIATVVLHHQVYSVEGYGVSTTLFGPLNLPSLVSKWKARRVSNSNLNSMSKNNILSKESVNDNAVNDNADNDNVIDIDIDIDIVTLDDNNDQSTNSNSNPRNVSIEQEKGKEYEHKHVHEHEHEHHGRGNGKTIKNKYQSNDNIASSSAAENISHPNKNQSSSFSSSQNTSTSTTQNPSEKEIEKNKKELYDRMWETIRQKRVGILCLRNLIYCPIGGVNGSRPRSHNSTTGTGLDMPLPRNHTAGVGHTRLLMDSPMDHLPTLRLCEVWVCSNDFLDNWKYKNSRHRPFSEIPS